MYEVVSETSGISITVLAGVFLAMACHSYTNGFFKLPLAALELLDRRRRVVRRGGALGEGGAGANCC